MGRPILKYLLDSVILIDHLNAIPPATAFLQEHGHACSLSAITRAEVQASLENNAVGSLARELLDLFPTLPLTAETADLAARLRKTRHLKHPDAFQAAVAVLNRLVLVTRNTRDFGSGSGLRVLVPYRL